MEQNIINFYNNFIKLNSLIRSGWLMKKIPTERLESVAEHTLQLIMLTTTCIQELKIKNINTERMMYMCMLHDLAEIKVGDISEIFVTNDDELKEKEKKETEAFIQIIDDLSADTKDFYLSIWNEFIEQNTTTAKFVRQCDKLDSVLKAKVLEEEHNLNGLVTEFYTTAKNKGIFNEGALTNLFNSLEQK